MQLAPEEPGDLPADRETEPGAAVLPARAAISLLERLENDLLLVLRDADAGIGHREGQHRARGVERLVVDAPLGDGRLRDREADAPRLRELERVREEVPEDLTEPHLVGTDRIRHTRRDLDVELQVLVVGDVPESPIDVVAQIGDSDLDDVDAHRPGFDLGKVEDLVDEREEIRARLMNGARVLDLPRGEVLVPVVDELPREDEQAVQRRAKLVRHVREELRLVAGRQGQLLGLLLELLPRELDLAVLALDLALLGGELTGLLLELLVRLLQLLLLGLELVGHALGFTEQLVGAHRRLDGGDDDAEALHQLLQERELRVTEALERRELEDALDLRLERDGNDDDVERLRLPQRGIDADVVLRDVRHEDALLLAGRLPDEALAQAERVRDVLALLVGVRREELQVRLVLVHLRHEEGAMLRADDGGELRQHLIGDGEQIALALQHSGEPREVRLEPILLLVHARRLGERADHLVDVVLQQRNLAARVDGDGLRQVALRHGGRDVADGAHLARQVAGELVHVVRQIAPHADGSGHVGLAAQASLDADVAGHAGHLLGERRERHRHAVDRLHQRRDLALGLQGELLVEVAVGDRGDDPRDAAHLLREVPRHEVHVVGQAAPHAGYAAHLGLAAELPFGTHLARDARHLGGEGVQLIDHRVDGVLQLEQLAFHVDGDLAGEVAVGDGSRHRRDVANLAGQVRRHQVHVVRQLLPHAEHAANLGLAAELALHADVSRHARHLIGEGAQLVDHRVDDVLQIEELAADFDGDLPAEVALRDGGGDLRDVANLVRQVRRHQVHVVGQLLPHAADALD